MKILIDARSLGARPSGIGMYIYNLVIELNKYKNYTIELITDVSESKEMQELKDAGMHVYEYGHTVSKSLALFSYYRFVQKSIMKAKAEVFWEGNTLIPIKIRNPYGRMFTTIHDMFPLTYPQYYGKKYPIYFKYGIKKSLKYFDTIIYNSLETKNETERLFPKAKNIDSFLGYIIVPTLPKIPIIDNNCFLYIGNLEKRKGTDLLLKAYKRYKSLGGEKGLRLGGKIREEDILKLYNEIKNTTDGIKYLGYLSDEERNTEYASCSVFIFPSKAEGFGMPIIEVMNYYKPIIATNLSIFKEIVGDLIEYISLDEEYEKQIENIALAMLNLKTDIIEFEKYKNEVDKYSGAALGKRFADYLNRVSIVRRR